MKIKTQAGILITLVTIVPAFFLGLLAFITYGQSQLLKSSISDEVKKIYSCMEKENWADFNLDKNIVSNYCISSLKAEVQGKTIFYREYESAKKVFNPEVLPDIYMKGYTTYVWTLPEIEDHLKDNLKNCSGFGKYNVVFTIKMPTDAFIKPLDKSKMIATVGAIVLMAAITAFVVLLIINISRTIRAMEKILKGWKENDFSIRLPKICNDELLSLANNFNEAGKKIHEDAAMKDRFIMGLSHDFKTPIALINGYSEVLQKELPPDDENIQKHLSCIQSNAEQLDVMIAELLDFVSLEGGELPFYFEETNLASWLNTFVLRVKNDAALMGKTITSDIRLKDNLLLKMDSRLMDRAMNNIVQNAIRYTEKDGEACISAEETENSVIISVTDNGPGIAKKDLPHIFDMFYRASPERDRKGMGIGLSVVKTVADGHGWTVRAENVKPHGAKISFEIPVEK